MVSNVNYIPFYILIMRYMVNINVNYIYTILHINYALYGKH